MSDQQVLLRRQEAEQQEKVKASVPDENKLAQLEKQVKHLKKGTLHHTHTQHTRAAVFFVAFYCAVLLQRIRFYTMRGTLRIWPS